MEQKILISYNKKNWPLWAHPPRPGLDVTDIFFMNSDYGNNINTEKSPLSSETLAITCVFWYLTGFDNSHLKYVGTSRR